MKLFKWIYQNFDPTQKRLPSYIRIATYSFFVSLVASHKLGDYSKETFFKSMVTNFGSDWQSIDLPTQALTYNIYICISIIGLLAILYFLINGRRWAELLLAVFGLGDLISGVVRLATEPFTYLYVVLIICGLLQAALFLNRKFLTQEISNTQISGVLKGSKKNVEFEYQPSQPSNKGMTPLWFWVLLVFWGVSNIHAHQINRVDFVADCLLLALLGYALTRYEKTYEELMKWFSASILVVFAYQNLPLALLEIEYLIDDIYLVFKFDLGGRLGLNNIAHILFSIVLPYALYKVLVREKTK